MTAVNDVSNWIQNVLKTSKSYSNNFYYDGHGIISEYEKSMELQKQSIKIVESKRKILEKIHKIRLEEPNMFTHLYKDMNRLEMEKFELELQIAKNELSHSNETLIILKNLVALSKITDTLMQELPQTARTKEMLKSVRQFQLSSESTVDIMKQALDEKFKDADKKNKKDR